MCQGLLNIIDRNSHLKGMILNSILLCIYLLFQLQQAHSNPPWSIDTVHSCRMTEIQRDLFAHTCIDKKGQINSIFESYENSSQCSISYDTLVHDLANALTFSNQITFPVFTIAQNWIYSVDFEIKFSRPNITFDTLICLDSNLNYLYYFNPNDSVLRLTSHSLIPIPTGSPIFEIKISSLNNEVCVSDINYAKAYLNGDLSINTITNCIINTTIEANTNIEPLLKIFPNPANESVSVLHDFSDEVFITDVNGNVLNLVTHIQNNNTLVLETGSLASGIYIVKICNKHSVITKKFIILHQSP